MEVCNYSNEIIIKVFIYFYDLSSYVPEKLRHTLFNRRPVSTNSLYKIAKLLNKIGKKSHLTMF